MKKITYTCDYCGSKGLTAELGKGWVEVKPLNKLLGYHICRDCEDRVYDFISKSIRNT